MKNYLTAFLLCLGTIILINCHRNIVKPAHQRVVLAGEGIDTIVLEEKFKVGDTISFVYTDRPLLFDTLFYEVNPDAAIKFLNHEKGKIPQEMLMMRMDMSEVERRTENIFTVIAKKKGTAFFSVVSQFNPNSFETKLSESRVTWKFEVE